MDRERWQRIERLYHDALGRRAEERPAFLAEACGGDAALQQEVASLLEERRSGEDMLRGPAAALIDDPGFARDSTADALLVGATLGNYRIERLLGRGGMGDEMVTGRAPFTGATVPELFSAILTRPRLRSPRACRPRSAR